MSLHPAIFRSRHLAPFVLVLISAAVAAAAYLHALGYPFIMDDIFYISKNQRLAELPMIELWRLFTRPYNTFSEFLPLRDLSYWFDMTLFGLNPAAFRPHNIILHLLCLPLVYATTLELWRYFRPADTASAPWAAAAVTSLFALHPTLVEPVMWISGRKYELASLFSMLALWFAIRARREHGISAPHAAASLVVFAAMMFSKTSYVTMSPVIALLWLTFWRDAHASHRRRSQLLWPFAILLLAALLNLIFMASKWGNTERMSYYFGIEAVQRTLAVLGWMARLAVSPEDRHFFYPVLEDAHLSAMIALGVAVLAAALAGTVIFLRKRSTEGFAIIIFFLLCMPYIQLIPFAPPSLVSDRWLALAVWPAILLLVALSWRLKPVPRAILLLAIALSWSFQTVVRPSDWRGSDILIDSDIRAFPGHYMPAYEKIITYQLPKGLNRDAMETANSIAFPEFRNIMIKLIKIDDAVTRAMNIGKTQEVMVLFWGILPDIKKRPEQVKWNGPANLFWRKIKQKLVEELVDLDKNFPEGTPERSDFYWYLNALNEASR